MVLSCSLFAPYQHHDTVASTNAKILCCHLFTLPSCREIHSIVVWVLNFVFVYWVENIDILCTIKMVSHRLIDPHIRWWAKHCDESLRWLARHTRRSHAPQTTWSGTSVACVTINTECPCSEAALIWLSSWETLPPMFSDCRSSGHRFLRAARRMIGDAAILGIFWCWLLTGVEKAAGDLGPPRLRPPIASASSSANDIWW